MTSQNSLSSRSALANLFAATLPCGRWQTSTAPFWWWVVRAKSAGRWPRPMVSRTSSLLATSSKLTTTPRHSASFLIWTTRIPAIFLSAVTSRILSLRPSSSSPILATGRLTCRSSLTLLAPRAEDSRLALPRSTSHRQSTLVTTTLSGPLATSTRAWVWAP